MLPIISLDIETYGICDQNLLGESLPPQRFFEPRRMLLTDKVPLDDLIQTVSITVVGGPSGEEDLLELPREGLSISFLKTLTPKKSMTLVMRDKNHRRILRRWLEYARAIIGFNLAFDISCLRSQPDLRPILDGRHLLVTADHLKFLWSDTLNARSLKSLGPALSLYSYFEEKTAKNTRFPGVLDPELHLYNARDSHRSLLLAVELCGLIERDFPNTAKLSPFALTEMSEILYTAIRMQEAGAPIHKPTLEKISRQQQSLASAAAQECASRGCRLENTEEHPTGCDLIKREYLAASLDLIDSEPGLVENYLSVPAVRAHSLYDQTDTGKTGITDQNRRLCIALLSHIPPDSPRYLEAQDRLETLKQWSVYVRSNGTYTKYCAPLLTGKPSANAKSPLDSLLLPPSHFLATGGLHPHVHLSHSLWYALPGAFKDDSGGEGGQKQGRLSARNPQLQQWTPLIKTALRSRWGAQGTIIAMDLSQIELRVAALLSGDPSLCAAYTSNLDLHTQRTVQIYGEGVLQNPHFNSGDRENDPRQWGKQMNFADLYLSGAAQLQTTIFKLSGRILPISFFSEIVASRIRVRPGLMAWHQTLFREVRDTDRLTLPFTGHSRTFINGTTARKPGGGSPINEIVNFPVQTVAALTLRSIQRYLHRHLPSLSCPRPKAYLFANIHDAVLLDTHISEKQRTLDTLRAAVRFCSEHEYWSWWQNRTGRNILLSYSVKEIAA